jgi:CRISPR-associated protein Csm3
MITADLKIISGLHIGGSDDTMKIGGVDSPVLKRVVYLNEKGEIDYSGREFYEPYIPGSSLKGKIRSLLEHYFGLHKKLLEMYRLKEQKLLEKMKNDNYKGTIKSLDKDTSELAKKITKTNIYKEYKKINKLIGHSINSSMLDYFNNNEKKYADLVINLFGESGGNEKKEITIASLIFRDAFIKNEIRKKAFNDDIDLTEEKFENVIDRFSGTTKAGGLRQIERVVPGIEFDFKVIIREFNNINKELAKKTLLLGMRLLEEDYLGGNGSRGYGEVKFICDELSDKENLKKEIDKLLGIFNEDEINKNNN